MSEEHQYYMERCLALGEQARLAGESPVGCVIVRDGQIIGEGYEQSRGLKDITRHAEVVAILDAVQRHGDCKGAILYSNVEPCILCSYVVRHHRIAKVVFSKYCGELGGTSPEYGILTAADISSWGTPPEIVIYP